MEKNKQIHINIEDLVKDYKIFYDKEKIKEKIKENDKQIENYKKKIFGMCCGNPHDLYCSKDCEGNEIDPIDILVDKLEKIFEGEKYGYETLIQENCKLQLFLDNFDEIKK